MSTRRRSLRPSRLRQACFAIVPALALTAACSPGFSNGPDGSTADAGVTGAGPVDAGQHDAGPADAGPGLTCEGLLACDERCGSSNTCTNQCYAETTEHGQALFNTFDDCLNTSCPSTDGGPCANANSTDCSTCDQSAAEGACVGNLANCENDTTVGPPNPDGGMGGDGGAGDQELSCGGLVACNSNCPMDGGVGAYDQCQAVCQFSATPQAVALDGELNACLNMACPATDGGVCATMDEACAGCEEEAVFAMPNICAVPWTNCQDDSSSGDGGYAPAVLQDAGTLSTVVTGIVQAASALVVQNNYLYFAAVNSDSNILRLSLAGGGTANLPDAGDITPIGPPQQTPAGIAVDSSNIYVWSYGSFSGATALNNDDGTVVQIPLNGGSAITLDQNMEVLYDAPYLNSVTYDSNNVYWVKGASDSDGVIMKTPIGSGSASAQAIYTMQEIPEAIATDGTNVYWADWGTFAVSGASNNDATIWQGSINGGTPTMLASNQEAPSCIATDGTNVYWSNLGQLGADLFPATDSGSIVQVQIGGANLVTLASGQAIPTGLAVGNGMIYWTDYGLSVPGVVMSIPVGGATPVPLVGGLDDPFSLTLAGSTLYWTNTPSSNGHGTIFSFTPF